jgi:hypothetical protein
MEENVAVVVLRLTEDTSEIMYSRGGNAEVY